MSQRSNDYTQIAQAMDMSMINHKVNLIGIVLETTIPRQSNGTDFYCLVKLIDQSYPSHGLSVGIFTEEIKKMPSVLNRGDIIKLSNVMMKVNKSVVYAQFNKKTSSFALFEGENSTDSSPYQHYSAASYNAWDQDKTFVLGLRKWWVDNHIATTDSRVFQSLEDIREGDGFNLFCKILHVRKGREDEWMLLVWDGTDTPPAPINARLEDERENPLPLESLPVCLPRDLLCKLPPVGTVLRVTGGEKLDVSVLKTNRWVKFDNLRCQLHASLWHASLLLTTRFCYLHDEDDIVLQRTRPYDERFKSRWGWMPRSSFPWPSHLTVTDHGTIPFCTLMRALANDTVIGKFHCVVRVVASFPWRVEDYRSPTRGIYRVRLTLEDPTARIHAYLFDKEAEQFFDGYPSIDVLTRKRNLLLGISESDSHTDSEARETSRNPPWITCCLKSYYVDENNQWGTRNFKIFATLLKG